MRRFNAQLYLSGPFFKELFQQRVFFRVPGIHADGSDGFENNDSQPPDNQQESCSLHTVLDCPGGTFLGAGVKTVVLFFEKGAATRKVWFYQPDPGRSLGKTNPLNDNDLIDFIDQQRTFADSGKNWSVAVKDIDPKTFDLSVKNPNGGGEITHRSPAEIMREIAELDQESARF